MDSGNTAYRMLSTCAALKRCKEIEPQIRAWVHLVEEPSLPAGIDGANNLAGIAFGVKDVINVQGMPTRSGSMATPSVAVQLDATCVTQLRDAGAVPIGKTVTAEFAYTSPGPTRNPHNIDHTPGGSSSGSAAAVAAGMVSFALGTQTGGSIIRPAAFCGVIGFKPTFGRIHRHGMDVLCDSLDTIGWFSQCVEQSIAVASVLLASPKGVPLISKAHQGLPRIAILDCKAIAQISLEASTALDDCSAHLQHHGATILRPSLDSDLNTLLRIHTQIMHAELARGLLSRVRIHSEDISHALRNTIAIGLKVSYVDYVELQNSRRELENKWRSLFENVDIIMTPSALGEAPKGLDSTGSSVLNRMWTLLGWPCLHLPTSTSARGLPVGVQLIGQPDTDISLLNWASSLHPIIDKR